MRFFLLLAVAIMGLVVTPAPAPEARTILAAVPISRTDLPWWRKRHEAKLEELRRHKPELVFYGDSITQNWEKHGPPAWMDFVPVWNHFYGDRNAVNLGFIGDTTASLLWRVENGEASGISPKVAVILIGANNLGRVHWSAEDTVAGIDAILAALHQRLPRTKILLLSVLPSERSEWATTTTAQINRMLAAKFGPANGVTFIDVSAVFMKGGRLNRDLFYDPRLKPPEPPLHPTAEAQARLAAAIEPTLASLLGDRQHSPME
jgi:lysophospholipase L1-like esterase